MMWALVSWSLAVFVFSGANSSMSDAIKLHPCNIIDVASLEGPADYQAMANNQDTLSGLDDLVHSWCKQIEQVSLKLYDL